MFDVTQQRAFSLEALCCKTETQKKSCKLKSVSQGCQFLTPPSLTFSLMPVKNFRGGEMQGLISVRGQEEIQSEWQVTVLSIPCQPERDLSSILRTSITPLNKSPTLDYIPKSGSIKQQSITFCLFFSAALKKSLECSRDECLTTSNADLIHFLLLKKPNWSQLPLHNQYLQQ